MSKVTEHQTLLERTPLVRDVQSASLLLLFCVGSRANYWLRTVRPDLTLQFAMAHDHDVLLEVPVKTFALNATMSLPLSKGGLGLRSAVRSREAAHWASWAACLPMVQKRHPQVAGIMLQGLNGGGEMASTNVVCECAASLADADCVLPSWFELVDGVRPPVPEDTGDPFQPRQASNTVEELHLREALPALPPPQRALVRSQGGPLSSRPFVGAAWVRCRERHRQDLPRGRRTRVHERVRAGFGSRTVQPPRWSSSGGRGRWAVTVWWGPVGH